jgi:hypothetical protein
MCSPLDVNVDLFSSSPSTTVGSWLVIIRHTDDNHLITSQLDFRLLYAFLHHRGLLSARVFSYNHKEYRYSTSEVHSYACGLPRHRCDCRASGEYASHTSAGDALVHITALAESLIAYLDYRYFTASATSALIVEVKKNFIYMVQVGYQRSLRSHGRLAYLLLDLIVVVSFLW